MAIGQLITLLMIIAIIAGIMIMIVLITIISFSSAHPSPPGELLRLRTECMSPLLVELSRLLVEAFDVIFYNCVATSRGDSGY